MFYTVDFQQKVRSLLACSAELFHARGSIEPSLAVKTLGARAGGVWGGVCTLFVEWEKLFS